MPAQKVYNSDEVEVIFGPVIMEGYADGEFLTIEQESDDIDDVVGTDGEVAVSRTNDRRATATVKLLQTSNTNDLLSAIHLLGLNSPGMAGGIHPFVVKDRNGRTLIEGANAWIKKAPDRSFDKTATSCEWVIRIAQIARFDGGN